MPHNPLGPIAPPPPSISGRRTQFCLAGPRVSPTEQLGFHDPDWFPTQLHQDEYRLMVPDAPGLGVEFNEDRALRTDFKYWEPPHLRRHDGTVTNW